MKIHFYQIPICKKCGVTLVTLYVFLENSKNVNIKGNFFGRNFGTTYEPKTHFYMYIYIFNISIYSNLVVVNACSLFFLKPSSKE